MVSIWTGGLATFRDRIAGLDPVPAGVSAAAVSATFGLGLLTKVLAIASKRKDFAGDRALVDKLIHEANNKSQVLAQLADSDIAAFRQYLDCVRRKESTDAAIRRAIEIPLQVARTAEASLPLCEQAGSLIHAFVAADLGAAVALLTGAIRASLGSVEFNLQQLPEDDPYRVEVAAELKRLWQPFRSDR